MHTIWWAVWHTGWTGALCIISISWGNSLQRARALRWPVYFSREKPSISTATIPQIMPPTGHATQNHMADVPTGSKSEGSATENTV